jgi:hypothetical protein
MKEQKWFMFLGAVPASLVVVGLLVLWTKLQWSTIDFVVAAILVTGLLTLVIVVKATNGYGDKPYGTVWWSLVLPFLVGSVYLDHAVWGIGCAIALLVLVILHDVWVYETSPAGGISVRRDSKGGVVWEITSGMFPSEIRRMRRKQKKDLN